MRRLFFGFLFLLQMYSPLSFCQEKAPRTVLFIMGKLVLGGIEKAFIELMNQWSVPNTKIEIMLLERGGVMEPLLTEKFPIISPEEVRHRSYDVAAYFLGYGPKEVIRSSLARGKRKFCWIHTDLLNFKYDHFFRHAEDWQDVDGFVFVSKKTAQGGKILQPQWSEKIFTIFNVLDGEMVKRKAKEGTNLFPSDGICNVVSVGRLSPEKGFSRAISVHSKLNREGIKFRWFLLGSGPETIKLKKEVKRAGLEKKFLFLGTQINPYPYIAQADIIVQPSHLEACSVVINEAKILGRPIVMTEVGAAREQLVSEENGLIVDNSNEGVYLGLKRLLLDPGLRTKFSSALQSFEYDNASIYRDIEHLFFPGEECK